MKTGQDTRDLLVDAATRVFAEQGVHNGSLLEVTRLAGQRNRGAVHYHFGSREGILVAVMEPHVALLARREGELLEVARARPDDDVASVLEAIVRPIVELSELDWRGACFLRIVSDVIAHDPATTTPEVRDVLARTGGEPIYALLDERLPLPEPLRTERLGLTTVFLLQSVADRAAALDRAPRGREQLAAEPFIVNLVAMAVGMLTAPLG